MSLFRLHSRHSYHALLLGVALLLAQWTGLHHRTEHAGIAQGWQQSSSSSADGTKRLVHSCLAFDAATIGDVIHLPPFAAPLITGMRALALWPAFTSWDAPLVRHFSSRAPPVA